MNFIILKTHFYLYICLLSLTILLANCDSQLVQENQHRLEVIESKKQINYQYIANSVEFESMTIFITPINLKTFPGKLTLYVSQTNENPLKDGYDQICSESHRMVGCVFNFTQKNKNQKVFFTIQCNEEKDPCNFSLRVQEQKQLFLEFNQKVIITTQSNELEPFSIKIPNKDSFERILVIVDMKRINQRIFSEGSEPKMDILFGEPVYHITPYRMLGMIKSSDNYLCPSKNCEGNIIIQLPQQNVFEIEIKKFNKDQNELEFNTTIIDQIKADQPQIYKLVLNFSEEFQKKNNKDYSLVISSKSISGTQISISVNADKIPENENWHWKGHTPFYQSEDIIINNIDINRIKVTGKVFYIKISSQNDGFFEIKSSMFQDSRLIPLDYDHQQSGYIYNMEVINYELEVWNFLNTDSKQNASVHQKQITIHLAMQFGNAHLYGRKCYGVSQNDCQPIQTKEINSRDQQLILVSDNHDGNKHLQFQSECPKEHEFCYYVIAVFGSSKHHNPSHFTLHLSDHENFFKILIQDQPLEDFIKLQQVRYYKLVVQNEENTEIEEIIINLNQNLQMMVSQQQLCLNVSQKCENNNLQSGDGDHPIKYNRNNTNKNSLDGKYYIAVYGIKAAEYMINAVVNRVKKNHDRAPSDRIIQLLEGKMTKGQLDQFQYYQYFKFEVSLISALDIQIQIQQMKAQTMTFYVCNCKKQSLPNVTHNQWSSGNSNFLDITKEDKHYVRSGTYLIRLELNEESRQNLNIFQQYSIQFTTQKTLITLETNYPYKEQLKPGQSKYFQFSIDYTDDDVYITKQVLSPQTISEKMAFFISTKPYPNFLNHQYTSLREKSSTLFISKAKLKEYCLQYQEKSSVLRSQNHSNCRLYVTAENTDEVQTMEILLRLNIKSFATQIFDGFLQQFQLKPKLNYEKFYFYPRDKNDIEISAYSYNVKVHVFANLFKDTEKIFNSNYPYPNYQQLINLQASSSKNDLTIDKISIEACWPDCVLLLSIGTDQDLKKLKTSDVKVYISVNQNKKMIYAQENVGFSMKKDEAKVFYFDLKNVIQSEQDLYLSLNTYSGKSVIFMNINYLGKNYYPNQFEYDFICQSGQMKINYQTIKNLLGQNIDKSPFLVMGVLNLQNTGKFSLRIDTSNQRFMNILDGDAQVVDLDPNQRLIFYYYNYQAEKFKIRLTREFGTAILQVSACSQQKDNLNQCVNTPNIIQEVNSVKSGMLSLDLKTYDFFCQNCIYLIQVTGKHMFHGDLIIHQATEYTILQQGKSIFDEVDENQINFYKVYVPNEVGIEIIVNVLKGDPHLQISFKKQEDPKLLQNFYQKDPISNSIHVSIPPRNLDIENSLKDSENFQQIVHNILYIIIKGNKLSQYTITYNFGSLDTIVLKPGVIDMIDIPSENERKISFQYYQEIKNPEIQFLLINSNNSTNLSALDIELKHIPQKYPNDYQEKSVNLNYKEFIYFQQFTKSLILKFSNSQKGIYQINLKNKLKQNINHKINEQQTMKLSVGLNFDDVFLMPEDFVIQQFIDTGNYRYFEFYNEKEGYLSMELKQCIGYSELYFSDTYENLVNKKFKVDFKALDSDDQVLIKEIKKGPVYFALKGSHQLQNYFSLSSHFYQKYNEIPQVKFELGDKGKISYYFEHMNKNRQEIHAAFSPVFCNNCSDQEMKDLKIKYIALASNYDWALNCFAKCQSQNKSDKNWYASQDIFNATMIDNRNLLNIKADIVSHAQQSLYYLTILAEISNFDSRQTPVRIYYQTLEIQGYISLTEKYFSIGLIVLIFVCIVLCGGGLLYYKRQYLFLKKRVTYAMSDLEGNTGQITAQNLSMSTSKQEVELENKTNQSFSKNYHELQDEKTEDL